MRIFIEGVVQNLKVTSVILESDPLNPDALHIFRCPSDGNIVCQYKGGDIAIIVPGETPALLPLIVRCKPCQRRYFFHSIA